MFNYYNFNLNTKLNLLNNSNKNNISNKQHFGYFSELKNMGIISLLSENKIKIKPNIIFRDLSNNKVKNLLVENKIKIKPNIIIRDLSNNKVKNIKQPDILVEKEEINDEEDYVLV